MQQRDDVADKYERVYAAIAGLVASTVANTSLSPREIYAHLKLAVPATWATSNWIASRPEKSSVADQKKFARGHLAEVGSWITTGERFSGSRADYYRAADAFFANIYFERLSGCDLVLDLGCGWGHRMWDLYLLGLEAQFFGGDRSEHSRSIMESLKTLFPEARMERSRSSTPRPTSRPSPEPTGISVSSPATPSSRSRPSGPPSSMPFWRDFRTLKFMAYT
jgi:hypothetical protein